MLSSVSIKNSRETVYTGFGFVNIHVFGFGSHAVQIVELGDRISSDEVERWSMIANRRRHALLTYRVGGVAALCVEEIVHTVMAMSDGKKHLWRECRGVFNH